MHHHSVLLADVNRLTRLHQVVLAHVNLNIIMSLAARMNLAGLMPFAKRL